MAARLPAPQKLPTVLCPAQGTACPQVRLPLPPLLPFGWLAGWRVLLPGPPIPTQAMLPPSSSLPTGRQYREAWAALRTAKRLHWAGTGLEHEPQENEATLADLALIFPPVQPGTAALRSTEAAGTETAKPPLGAEPAGRQQGEQQERRAGGRPGAVLQAVAGPVAAKLGRVARAWRAAADRAVERLAQLLRWGAGGPDDGGSSQACPASSQEAAAAPAVAEAASQEPAELRPIFVTGLPRSGTTLLEQILSRHAELCTPCLGSPASLVANGPHRCLLSCSCCPAIQPHL